MVQYRKSKKVGPFRFTLSQRGISTSVGAGPLRVSRGADGKVRRTVRVPGTGIYDTKIVGGQNRTPASASEPKDVLSPNLIVQLGKLFLILLVLGFILSVVTSNLAVGFGIVGSCFVALLAYLTVRLAPLAFSQRTRHQSEQSVEQPVSEAKRPPERAVLEAEAEAAEAEAQAAAAWARAIRLRLEALGNAIPALGPQHSDESDQLPVSAQPRKATVAESQYALARAVELQLGDRVKVVALGDNSHLKAGTVTRILDGGDVEVKLGTCSGTYTFGTDELQFLSRPARW